MPVTRAKAATIAGFFAAKSLRTIQASKVGAPHLPTSVEVTSTLPVGLIAGSAVQGADVSDQVTRAILIGVDLGPNLSVTGSLATILWLVALRREEIHVTAWQFLKLGWIVMIPALMAAIGVGSAIFPFIAPLPAPLNIAGYISFVWLIAGIVYAAWVWRTHPDRARQTETVFVDAADDAVPATES